MNEQQKNIRIRKLTERECFRLMGVKEEDYQKITKDLPTTWQYHLAGDSIVTSVLMSIFGELLGIDYESKIDELIDDITNDTERLSGGGLDVIGNVTPSEHEAGKVYDINGLSPTFKENHGTGVCVKTNTQQGYEIAQSGDSINLLRPSSTTRRGRVGHQIAQTLETSINQGVLE